MSNLSAARRALFGTPKPLPREPKPFDRFTKAELWGRVEMLERRLARVRTLAARYAGDANNRREAKVRDEFHEIGRACDLSTNVDPG